MGVIYIAPKNVKQTHRRSHCTSVKRITSILRHVVEEFPPARQGTILNSHRVIGWASNTSMVLNYCALVTGCSLTSYPGQIRMLRVCACRLFSLDHNIVSNNYVLFTENFSIKKSVEAEKA